mmetsp:Transcript_714/g.1942  ORF Transcript_714/g.1942 Transcript_714/m.1942 type:complete len:202 (+) Transcript_714:327-932(+)
MRLVDRSSRFSAASESRFSILVIALQLRLSSTRRTQFSRHAMASRPLDARLSLNTIPTSNRRAIALMESSVRPLAGSLLLGLAPSPTDSRRPDSGRGSWRPACDIAPPAPRCCHCQVLLGQRPSKESLGRSRSGPSPAALQARAAHAARSRQSSDDWASERAVSARVSGTSWAGERCGGQRRRRLERDAEATALTRKHTVL